MQASRTRPFIILPVRTDDQEDDELRATHIKLVPHACEACGAITTRATLCSDCEERTHQHEPDDPYDVLGGEQGTE